MLGHWRGQSKSYSWRDGTLYYVGRPNSIMFGRILYEDSVWKDTLHFVRKDTYQNQINKFYLIDSQNGMSVFAILKEIYRIGP